MELGATVCTPQKPKCNQCPVQKQCLAYQKQVCVEESLQIKFDDPCLESNQCSGYWRMFIDLYILFIAWRSRFQSFNGRAVSSEENQNEATARNIVRSDSLPFDTETGISNDQTEKIRSLVWPVDVLGDHCIAWSRSNERTKTQVFCHRRSATNVRRQSGNQLGNYQISGTGHYYHLKLVWIRPSFVSVSTSLLSHRSAIHRLLSSMWSRWSDTWHRSDSMV